MPVPAGSGSAPAPVGLSYDPVLSRVRLSVQAPSSAASALVERSTDQVRWAAVRGAAEVAPTVGGLVSVSDYEFAPGVVNYYRVRAFTSVGDELGPALNRNPYVEANADNWTGVGGTVARSTAQAHEGAASLLLTPDGVSVSAEARSDFVPATAGRTYRAAAWLRCAVSRSLGLAVNWYQPAGTFISQSASPTVAVAANTWTLVQFAVAAPALTGQARLIVGMASTPPTSHLEYIDEAQIVEVGAGPVYSGSITPALDAVWLKSLARPFLNMPVVVQDYTDVERPARSGVFDVLGRSFPVSVSDVRGSRRWTLMVLTQTAGEAEDLDLLLASGDPLLVHVPADCDVPSGYVTVGDTVQRRLARRSVRRVFELPCVEVAAPGPDVVGATVTCQTVLNTYPTCAAVLDAHDTCLSLMELIGDPTDVVVP